MALINEVKIGTPNGYKILLSVANDTVTPESLAAGKTAHEKTGKRIIGTFTIESELEEQSRQIAELSEAVKGKAGGGGSDIKTCLVTVVGGAEPPPMVPPKTGSLYYTEYKNGSLRQVFADRSLFGTQKIEIPCGTILAGYTNGMYAPVWSGPWNPLDTNVSDRVRAVPNEPTSGLVVDIS